MESRRALIELESLHWETLPDLQQIVWEKLAEIPPGRVTTYGALARALGDERARSARWLGDLLAHHEHAPSCCCHRVVRSNGEIGLFVTGDVSRKLALLRAEGIDVSPAGQVDISQAFTGFTGPRPLETLLTQLMGFGQQVHETALIDPPQTVAGVDVSYRPDGTACAAYVLLDLSTLEVRATLQLERPVAFPYLPGFLAVRELPVLKALCDQARAEGVLGDVIFVDGNGRLHPNRSGVASCLGVLLDHPVIGIGKSLLCGRIRHTPEGEAIVDQSEVIGAVLRSTPGSKEFYVSVGHRITLADSVATTRRTLTSHRLPAPIRLADGLTKQLRRGGKPA